MSSAQACSAPIEDVLRILGVDSRHGLSAMDVSERLRLHGANELEKGEDDPLWKKFLEKLKEPMIALLLASAGVSVVTGQYDDAISISLVSVVDTPNEPSYNLLLYGRDRIYAAPTLHNDFGIRA